MSASRRLETPLKRLECANSGHSPTAWRTRPIDPVEIFMPTPPGRPQRRKADRRSCGEQQERAAPERSRGWLRVSLYSVEEVQSVPIDPVERKLAAIFAADIAGYSRLMGRDEIGTLARLKAYRAVVDDLIASHRGRIFNTAGTASSPISPAWSMPCDARSRCRRRLPRRMRVLAPTSRCSSALACTLAM